jgi:PAS domain-containing protein
LFGLQRWFPPSPVILGLLLSYPLWSWQRQRQTLRRLDRQLTGMQQERSLRSLSRSRADLVAAMDFLGHLMPLQGWVLYKDERRLDGSGQVLGAPLVPLASGHWQRSGAELWILINRDEGSWRLGLLWPRTQVPNGRPLQLLSDMAQRFNGADTGCGAGWPALVEHRMRELREADLYQRHQCRLVEDALGELGEGLMVIDSLGRVIMSNPSAVSYLGGAQDEDFVGVEAGALLNSLEIQASLSWAEVWRRVLLEGEAMRFVARGASQRDISVRLRPFDRARAGGHGIVANFSLLHTCRESGQA